MKVYILNANSNHETSPATARVVCTYTELMSVLNWTNAPQHLVIDCAHELAHVYADAINRNGLKPKVIEYINVHRSDMKKIGEIKENFDFIVFDDVENVLYCNGQIQDPRNYFID